ncbi:MAG: hypothetical protein HOG49_03455 [Candidatus Scalindua sp.]|nr:hypothetical protein [Candidatus Scalindua sp.]
MSKARKKKTVNYVYGWDEKDGGTVRARIEFETHKTEWIARPNIKFENAEAVGESLLNKLRRDTLY